MKLSKLGIPRKWDLVEGVFFLVKAGLWLVKLSEF